MKINFTQMQETARQIENIAYLLRVAAETGELANAGDDAAEDTARLIMEKARELGQMLEQAAEDAQG